MAVARLTESGERRSLSGMYELRAVGFISGHRARARLADTRSQVFEARKLKNRPEKLPSFSAS